MPIYEYKAKNEEGKNVSGTLVVGKIEEVEKVLQQRNLFLVSVRPQSKLTTMFEGLYSSPQDTLIFTIQMATALQSGLPLIEILDDMIDEAPHAHFKRVLGDIKMNIEAGNSLANALELYPNYFSDIYRTIVGTGEKSGKLDMVFKDLVGLLEWEKELKKQVKKAMRFPITMGIMLSGLVFVVLNFVIPNFADLFSSSGTELPGPTLILLQVSEFLNLYWMFLLGGTALAVIAFKVYASSESGRFNVDALKLKVPFFGSLNQKVAMSRFAHFWKILFESGIDLSLTLQIVAEVVSNKKIEVAILKAHQDIVNGRSMTGSFEEAGIFPSLVLRMIKLGETTGALESSLDKVSQYYDKEVPEAIDALLAAMQPVVMLIMAGVLIMVALAIVLPMFGMMEAI